jgi:uncharacterized protein (TIGR02246 family)
MSSAQTTSARPPRPTLAVDGAAAQEAAAAVSLLVQELQAGWDQHDAEITDRRLASDVLWGSPFGAIVRGYEPLHEIHVRLKQQGMGGRSSRFEIAQHLVAGPGVVLAHVRRVALDDEGQPLAASAPMTDGFSELALYVLVKQNGVWWVAAGHNTPVRERPAQ